MWTWNQRRLLHALREFERFYNRNRPHQGIANAAPLRPLPKPITDPQQLSACTYVVANAWAESSTSTRMPHDLHG
jgi:hypothetical protein